MLNMNIHYLYTNIYLLFRFGQKMIHRNLAQFVNKDHFLQMAPHSERPVSKYYIISWYIYRIYRITGNFCDVKFLAFWSKKKTFNFCGFFFLRIVNLRTEKKMLQQLKRCYDKQLVHITVILRSINIVLWKVFKGYSFWIRIWLTSNLS
jgi:hypothetical protein